MGHQPPRLAPSADGPLILTLESLESRQLLSTSVAPVAAQTSGLIPIKWHGEHTFAAPGQWIGILNPTAHGAHKQIKQMNAQLAGTGIRAVRRLNDSNIFLFRGVEKPIDQIRA